MFGEIAIYMHGKEIKILIEKSSNLYLYNNISFKIVDADFWVNLCRFTENWISGSKIEFLLTPKQHELIKSNE
jgi:hypothetical protein